LPVLSGGTGQSSYTDGQILMGITAGNTLSKGTITAGSGISVTNGAGSITIAASGTSGVTTVGTIDSQVKSSNGLVISGTNIYAQTADPGFPGVLSTGAQAITGAKTFSSTPTFSTMTLGSSLFAGTGGILAQDNAYNFWDATNHRQGYGTTTPSSLLTVKNVTDSLNEGIAIEGSGAGPNVRWIHYVSPNGAYSLYHPVAANYGFSVDAVSGRFSAANGLTTQTGSGALTARGNSGRDADNIIVALNTASQSGDSFVHYASDFVTKLFRVDYLGNLTAKTLSASTLTTGIAHVGSTGLISSSAVDLSGADATGTLAAGRFPALAGDVTTSAGSLTTTIANLAVTNAKIANNTIDLPSKVTGVLPTLSGGTGQSTYTNGQILMGITSTNSLSKGTLTAGSGITITNGAGSITLSASSGSGITSTEWVSDNTILIPNALGFTSISNLQTFKKRVGDSLFLRGSFTMNAGAAFSADFGLVGVTMDTAKLPTNVNATKLMDVHRLPNSNGQVYGASNGLLGFYDGSTATTIYVTDQAAGGTGGQFDKVTVAAFGAAGNVFTFETLSGIPISGWTQTN
jgi:hypothetical protein